TRTVLLLAPVCAAALVDRARRSDSTHRVNRPLAFMASSRRCGCSTALEQRRPTRAMVVEGRNACKIAPASPCPSGRYPRSGKAGMRGATDLHLEEAP